MSKPRTSTPRKAPPHLRSVTVGEPTAKAVYLKMTDRFSVLVDPGRRLTPGCYALMIKGTRLKKLGRYWPGSADVPPSFATDAGAPENILMHERLRRPRLVRLRRGADWIWPVVGMYRQGL